jgi:HSP20 family protein
VAARSRPLRDESFRVPLDAPEVDVRFADLFDEADATDVSGDYTPPMDVMEMTGGVEILLDVPGLGPKDLRVMFARGLLMIAGRKVPVGCPHKQAAFHLAERSFGRFVRAVRVSGAVDAHRASAVLGGGELRVHLPRVPERRGRPVRIPVEPS